ncbi:MAG: metallophosphoesterase [Planctomycetes bacterium]|nr:metallophosphoesterase [Planctomycetota bacterium]
MHRIPKTRKLFASIYFATLLAAGTMIGVYSSNDAAGTIGAPALSKSQAEISAAVTKVSTAKKADRKMNKDPLTFVKGPYLGHVDAESVMVSVELSKEANALVTVKGENREWTFQSDEAKKFHEMRLYGFTPGERYAFQYSATQGSETISDNGGFRTAPTRDQSYRFAVYGDTRSNPAKHRQVCDEIAKFEPDMIVNVGDVCVNGDVAEGWQLEHFDPAREILKNAPYYISIGNHERNSHYYYDYMAYPDPENYYAFTYGNARFIVVDSNYDAEPFSPANRQFLWLRDQLESSVDNDFVFVFFHHPPFSEAGSGEFAVRGFLVPLFKRYKPDIVFNGHVHSYERGYADGVYYVITGGGGSGLSAVTRDVQEITVSGSFHHFVLMDVDGEKIHYQCRGLDDQLFEELYLKKGEDGLIPDEDAEGETQDEGGDDF